MLRSAKLFSFLSDSDYASLAAYTQRRTHYRGAQIVSAGVVSDGIHYIVSGKVSVLLEDRNGREYVVNRLGRDEFFGEACLFSDCASPVTCIAEEPSQTVFIPRAHFVRYAQTNAAFASYLLEHVLSRLNQAHRKIECLALMTVYERVARTLVETAEEVKGNWLVRMGSEQIARMVGASREMVSRVIRQMIDDGAVRKDKRLLFVTDPDLLADAGATPAEPQHALRRT